MNEQMINLHEMKRAKRLAWVIFFGLGVGYFVMTLITSLH